jgi:hypothetical protein
VRLNGLLLAYAYVLTPNPRGFWVKQRVVASIALLPWIYLVLSGCDLCFGSGAQSPNEQQLRFYVVTPIVGCAVAVIILSIAHKIPVALEWVIFIIQLSAFLWVFSRWGGGI